MIMKEYYIDKEIRSFGEEPTLAAHYEKRITRRRKGKNPWLLAALMGILLIFASFAMFPDWEIPMFHKTATTEYGWNLILVNSKNHIPSDYVDELVTLRNGQQVDSRIYPDLQDMFDTMRAEGIYPIVASGYRTEEKQRQLLDEKTEEYKEMGHSHWKARKEALQWVSIPGTSEHQLGIAVDINQEGTLSTAKQIYDWLANNAHRYGFIYRYPADKVAVTGISNEPWHYRYVGKEAAWEIYEKGICLEEYLEELQDS